jgi:hypothetical protein
MRKWIHCDLVLLALLRGAVICRGAIDLFLFAGLAFGEEKYLELWNNLPADPEDAEVRRNIAITQPVLWVR